MILGWTILCFWIVIFKITSLFFEVCWVPLQKLVKYSSRIQLRIWPSFIRRRLRRIRHHNIQRLRRLFEKIFFTQIKWSGLISRTEKFGFSKMAPELTLQNNQENIHRALDLAAWWWHKLAFSLTWFNSLRFLFGRTEDWPIGKNEKELAISFERVYTEPGTSFGR